MNDVAVTVAIPIYNGARFLAETIRSLLNQSERGFRLLCVDDASTDDSAGIASSFADPRLSVIVADRHGSLAENWNRALALAETPYVLVAHQDDLYERDYLATMLPLLAAHPRSFAVHCKTTSIDAEGRTVRLPSARYKETYWPAADPYEREIDDEIAVLGRGNYIVASTVLLRTAAVKEIGTFDPSLQFVTDWQYWLRGLRAGFTLTGTHARLVRFRRHAWTATRMTEASFRRYEEEIDVLRWLGSKSFRLVENTLTADFAERLASGDRDGARALLEFGARRIPGFGGMRLRMLRAALRGGRASGWLLRALQQSLVEVAVARHRFR